VALSRRGVEALAAIAVVAVLSLTWLPRLRGPIDLRWDAGAYYTLGTSIAEGKGYRELNEPGEIPAVNYPPALPLIVSAHQFALRTTDPVVVGVWLRRTFVLVWLGYVAAAYLLLRRFLPFPLALVGLAICGLSFNAVWLSDRLYADLPFAALAALFLFAAERKPTTRSTLWTWLIATAAFFTRTVALALFAGWIGDAIVRREWSRTAARVAMALLPVLAWQGYIAYVERGPSFKNPPYGYARADYSLYNVSYARNQMLRDPNYPERGRATVVDLARRVAGNIAAAPALVGGAVSATEADWDDTMLQIKATGLRRFVPWAAVPIGLFVLGATVIGGLVRLAVEKRFVIVFTTLAYLAQLCLLPWTFHWPRYLVGILPVLALAFLTAVRALASVDARTHEPLRVRWQAVAATAMVCFVIAMQVHVLAFRFRHDFGEVVHDGWDGHRVAYNLFTYDRPFQAFDRGLDWLVAHAAAPSVVVSSMAPWVYVRTNLRSIIPPMERRLDRVSLLLDGVPAQYVIVDSCGYSFTREYTLPLLRRANSGWRLAYEAPGGALQIYERDRLPPSRRAAAEAPASERYIRASRSPVALLR